jgi:acetyl-CoA carboxylase biotin carboxyl carrier protein
VDVEEIRKLIRLMEEAGLTELEIEDRSGKVRLVRGAKRRAGRAVDDRDASGASSRSASDDEDLPDLDLATAPRDASDRLASAVAAGNTVVTSPMVGTFYRAASPDAEPFVATGDVVHPGQVLCIIEAMKMMNEIHAEVAGRIAGIAAENGAPVEYGSPLFLLAPLD